MSPYSGEPANPDDRGKLKANQKRIHSRTKQYDSTKHSGRQKQYTHA